MKAATQHDVRQTNTKEHARIKYKQHTQREQSTHLLCAGHGTGAPTRHGAGPDTGQGAADGARGRVAGRLAALVVLREEMRVSRSAVRTRKARNRMNGGTDKHKRTCTNKIETTHTKKIK